MRRIDTDGDASIDLREWNEFMRPAAAPTAATVVTSTLPPVPYVPTYVPPYSRYWWDYPYASTYPRPWWWYRDPLYVPPAPLSATAPVAKTEKYEVERGPYWHSPSRTVKKTTYHSPAGDRTYTQYV